jgi:hypothetical protein
MVFQVEGKGREGKGEVREGNIYFNSKKYPKATGKTFLITHSNNCFKRTKMKKPHNLIEEECSHIQQRPSGSVLQRLTGAV